MSEKKKNIAPWWAKGDGSAGAPCQPQSHAHCGRTGARPSRVSRLKSLVLIATLLALLGGGAWWWLGRDGAQPSQMVHKAPKRERPQSVSIVATTNAPPKKAPAPAKKTVVQPKIEVERPRRVGELRDGYVLLPSGELRKVKGVITSGVDSTSIADTTFKYSAERMVAHLLLVEPGEGMLGDGESLYANFNEEFRESLDKEIEINDEDTPEQRELKAAVIDIRRELVERMNRGEDLAKVMVETRKQLQELALYKEELAEQVERLKKDGNFSKQDHLDLIEAANEMLKERGIKPFLIPSSLQHLVDLREAQKSESALKKGTNE